MNAASLFLLCLAALAVAVILPLSCLPAGGQDREDAAVPGPASFRIRWGEGRKAARAKREEAAWWRGDGQAGRADGAMAEAAALEGKADEAAAECLRRFGVHPRDVRD